MRQPEGNCPSAVHQVACGVEITGKCTAGNILVCHRENVLGVVDVVVKILVGYRVISHQFRAVRKVQRRKICVIV